LKQWDKALADFSKAIELTPNGGATPWSYLGRASTYRGLGRKDDAIDDLTKATERWPKLYDAWAWRGQFYRDLEQWDKSADDLSKAVELNPSWWPGYWDRAIARVHLKQMDGAVADLREAVKHGLPDAEQTLRNDNRLEELRTRDDLKALLVEVAKQKR